MSKTTFLVLLIVGLMAAPLGAQAPAAQPAVLFVPLRPDAQVAKHLEEAGFVWSNVARNQDLSADLLGHFSAVVLTEFPQVGTQGPTAEQTAYMDLLRPICHRGPGEGGRTRFRPGKRPTQAPVALPRVPPDGPSAGSRKAT